MTDYVSVIQQFYINSFEPLVKYHLILVIYYFSLNNVTSLLQPYLLQPFIWSSVTHTKKKSQKGFLILKCLKKLPFGAPLKSFSSKHFLFRTLFFSHLASLYVNFHSPCPPPEYNHCICKNKLLVFLLLTFSFYSAVYSHHLFLCFKTNQKK